MKDLNITKTQASAIVGNLIAESGLYPDRIQGPGIKLGKLKIDGKTGYGYAQWTSKDRQSLLSEHALSKGVNPNIQPLTDDVNYSFLLKELKSSTATNKLKTKTTLRDSTNVILTKFERPKDQGEGALQQRTSYAQQILDKL